MVGGGVGVVGGEVGGEVGEVGGVDGEVRGMAKDGRQADRTNQECMTMAKPTIAELEEMLESSGQFAVEIREQIEQARDEYVEGSFPTRLADSLEQLLARNEKLKMLVKEAELKNRQRLTTPNKGWNCSYCWKWNPPSKKRCDHKRSTPCKPQFRFSLGEQQCKKPIPQT